MLVWYYGSKDDFEAFVKKEMKGDAQDVTLKSVGCYVPRAHASFFYRYSDNFGSEKTTMQHEVTHQILGEYVAGGLPPVWLVEGVAVAMQEARPDSHGRLFIPQGLRHYAVAVAAKQLEKGKLPALSDLLSMNYTRFHQPTDRSLHYDVSGALCRCLLELDNGNYGPDFLEYLYDSYHGGFKPNLADYIGMDTAALEQRFQHYLTGGGQ